MNKLATLGIISPIQGPLKPFQHQGKYATERFRRSRVPFFKYFLLPLYSGDEVWEGICNQTHFSGIEYLSREITPCYLISR